MAKISVNPLLLLISKRCHTVAAESGRLGTAETAARKVEGPPDQSVSGTVTVKEKVFWMRDPNTGNWIPENHFGEIDVAELRNKYLSNAHKLTQTKLD
ncbi:protein SENESCENCE-ASSOCIATED GENE 21, mitochondrial-like [Prosopis cineraria]|uniref:protein SENESCENCE-ASSOCIATED GENE 21, mitochondrial-like n=1 Tax=Prosopis cineraria TaxID=364024 RepID=UPI00240F1D1A|nr:protein SENESCENCE-ASSOCIATED GENE 21, mitochondrial-like [Prosopis cineraria]